MELPEVRAVLSDLDNVFSQNDELAKAKQIERIKLDYAALCEKRGKETKALLRDLKQRVDIKTAEKDRLSDGRGLADTLAALRLEAAALVSEVQRLEGERDEAGRLADSQQAARDEALEKLAATRKQHKAVRKTLEAKLGLYSVMTTGLTWDAGAAIAGVIHTEEGTEHFELPADCGEVEAADRLWALLDAGSR
eukprot:PLAT9997.1.p2 GENE.PLAT9997.1~~PLAT9997.1.p2  ORF type:complete len:194 (-),score=80.14 PLAT9997.1:79-660(-)